MSDLIRRQDAIDALEKVAELYPWKVPGDRDSYSKYNEAWNDALDRAESEIEALPSAQPETHEERTETHSCDCISRKAAIDADGLDEEIRCEMCKNPMHTDRGCDGNCKYDEILYEKIIQILNKRITPLPSVQPEIILCKECEHWSRDSICDGFCSEDCMRHDEDFYCGYAERRTDETD